jgi:6-pyruvoyltetrahydropterin/6-carboxytetrahydropterin synthase
LPRRIATEWDDEKNEKVFGLCARPSFHGHSYTCDVTVVGQIDDVTGFAIDLAALDRILHTEIRERFDHRNINTDVPEFSEGLLVPTGENIARFIFERVARALSAGGVGARISSVRVAEDETLSVEYRGE